MSILEDMFYYLTVNLLQENTKSACFRGFIVVRGSTKYYEK